MNSSVRSMAAPVAAGADRHPDESFRSTSPGGDAAVAVRCVAGEPVTEDLVAAVADLEAALDRARLDRAAAQRQLRIHQDGLDEELAAALARCRHLEGEKLAAFGLDGPSDADVFRPVPMGPVEALTWRGLREQLEAAHRAGLDAQAREHAAGLDAQAREHAERLDAQARELAERYFGELQQNSLTNATAMQRQAQQWQARLDAEARRGAEDAERAAADRDRDRLAAEREGAAHRGRLEGRIGSLEEELRAARVEAAAAHRHVHELLTSTSWRAARPLRGVSRVLRWLKGR